MVDDRINHVLWYQNTVGSSSMASYIFEISVRHAIENPNWFPLVVEPMKANRIPVRSVVKEVVRRTGKPFPWPIPEDTIEGMDWDGVGNCLIIPLLGTWDSIKLMNTSSTPDLLKDVSTAIKVPEMRGFIQEKAAGTSFGASGGGIVLLQFDIYDIVLAENIRDIPDVLPQIQESKRPEVNPEVFSVLDKWYGCPVAVCCFNTNDRGTAKPLGFAFEPLYPDKLVVYTLDGHNGSPPDPNALVNLDHDIFVGSYLMKASPNRTARIRYSNGIPPTLHPYLLNNALGVPVKGQMENGDLIFSTDAVRAGHFEGFRSLPPFGPHELPRLGHKIMRQDMYV